jgi:hypothetical protein
VTQRRVLATQIVSALLQDLARSEILTSDEWRLVRHLFDEQLRERAVVGALSHAELVDLLVRQSVLVDRLQATLAEQQAGPAAAGGGAGEPDRGLAG